MLSCNREADNCNCNLVENIEENFSNLRSLSLPNDGDSSLIFLNKLGSIYGNLNVLIDSCEASYDSVCLRQCISSTVNDTIIAKYMNIIFFHDTANIDIAGLKKAFTPTIPHLDHDSLEYKKISVIDSTKKD